MTISSILDRFDRWVDILLYDRGGWWLKKPLPSRVVYQIISDI